jgi:hippurate hydrolase
VRGAYREAQEAGRLSELPTNHNPRFAPVVHPTLETGLETLAAAALAWLGAPVRA